MRTRTFKSIALGAMFLALPFAFFNCAGVGEALNSASSSSSVPLIGSAANGPVTLSSGQTGAVQVLEDRNYTIAFSGGTSTYTIAGLPTGATFNSTTGILTGVGPAYGSGATFTVRSNSKVFGPITLSVSGNPLKQYQWHLTNTGQTAFAGSAGTSGQDLHTTATVASGVTGTGIKIAFSDTGVFVAHEGLAPNLLSGQSRNYLNNYSSTGTWIGDPTPDFNTSEYAHGTAVAGLAIEKGWNGLGGRGLAPDASFASFLFIQAQTSLSNAGLSTTGFYDQFAGSFDIFNYSWGDSQCMLTEYPDSFFTKVAAAMSQRNGKGSILLQAGGNSWVESTTDCYSSASSSAFVLGNANMSEMQTTPYILSISAINADGVSSSYSTPGSNIWVSAPGGEFGLNSEISSTATDIQPALITTDFYGCGQGVKTDYTQYSNFDAGQAPNQACKYTSTMNGTSGATPLASAAVALLLQMNPNLTWRDVKYILAKTADKVDPTVNPTTHPDSALNLAGHQYEMPWVTNAAGFHFMNYYGFGRINVDNAIALAKTYSAGSLGTFKQSNWADDSGTVAIAIPDNNANGLTALKTVSTSMTIEAVQVKISISGCIGDMGLELTSPSGTKSILLNINNEMIDGAMTDHIFMSNAFYGESSAGQWTFKAIDAHASCTANLTHFALNFSGH